MSVFTAGRVRHDDGHDGDNDDDHDDDDDDNDDDDNDDDDPSSADHRFAALRRSCRRDIAARAMMQANGDARMWGGGHHSVQVSSGPVTVTSINLIAPRLPDTQITAIKGIWKTARLHRRRVMDGQRLGGLVFSV